MAARTSTQRLVASLFLAGLLHAAFLFARTPTREKESQVLELLDASNVTTLVEPEIQGGGLPKARERDPRRAGSPSEPTEEKTQPRAPAVTQPKAPPTKSPARRALVPAEPAVDPVDYEELIATELPTFEQDMAVPVRAARTDLIRDIGGAARRGVAVQGEGPGAKGRKGSPQKSQPPPASPFSSGVGPFSAVVCEIPKGTTSLRNLSCRQFTAYKADRINISERKFSAGFPGVSERNEWFAIKYEGAFEVKRSGRYGFRLLSDDGSRLYIDGALVIDNDGTHGPRSISNQVDLLEGRHEFKVEYFQGPRYTMALQLFVTAPGRHEKLFRPKF